MGNPSIGVASMEYTLVSFREMLGFPILSLVCYLPILGSLIIIFLLKNDNHIKKAATITAWVTFILSLLLIPGWNSSQLAMFHVERFDWVPSLGIQYFFGIDGISLLLVLLTTFLSALSTMCSWDSIKNRQKEYYVFLLILETGMLGVFMSLDFILFYVFWEVMLVPMYFLIGMWGSDRRLYSAIKFFLYTLLGSVLMLLGIIALHYYEFQQTGIRTFDILTFHSMALPQHLQFWIFLAFFIGFAIKVPMFPFHTWLPDAHTDAPTAGSVILAGVLLKMGTYGFLRFSLPILPEATQAFVPWMVGLSIFAIIYGALVAMVQKDWKRLVAYSSVSHMGFVTLGIFALNAPGLAGGTLQMINHGISTGALFLLVGYIYDRRHTRLISEYGGLYQVVPLYAVLFGIITMSSIGVPGLNGFMGEFPILQAAFKENWRWGTLAIWGIVLGAGYMLWLYQRIIFGPITKDENKTLPDLKRHEFITLILLVLMAFQIGLYPKPYFKTLEKPVQYILYKTRPSELKGRPKIFQAIPDASRTETVHETEETE